MYRAPITIEAFFGFLRNDLSNRNQSISDHAIHHLRAATKQMGQQLDSLLPQVRVRRTQ